MSLVASFRRAFCAGLAALALAAGPALGADQTPLKSVQAPNGPTHPANFGSGDTVGVAHGGTGATSFTGHCVLIGEGGSAFHVACPSSAGQVLTDNGASSDPSFQPVGGGTVTSVTVTLPAEFGCTGAPVTTSGTIACTWANESANKVLAGPTSGGAATPSFRALVSADIGANIVALASLAQIGGDTWLGNESGSTANVVANSWVNCPDTGGQHLNYSTATHLLGCGNSSLSSNPFLTAMSAHEAEGMLQGPFVSPGQTRGVGIKRSGTVGQGQVACWLSGNFVQTCNPFYVGTEAIGAAAQAPPAAPFCLTTFSEGALCADQLSGVLYSLYQPTTVIPSFIQAAGSGSYTITLGATPIPGDYLIGLCQGDTVHPTANTGWTQLDTIATSGNSPGGIIVYHKVITGDTTSQTLCTGSPTWGGAVAEEIAGLDPTNFTASVQSHAMAQTSAGGGGPISTTQTATTAQANTLAISLEGAYRSCCTGMTGASWNAGWTADYTSPGGDPSPGAAHQFYSANSSSVTATTTNNWGSGVGGMVTGLVLLKLSSDPLNTGYQPVSYLTICENSGSILTANCRSLNFSTGLSATTDADGDITIVATGSGLTAIGADSVLANFTGSSAVPVGNSMPSCPDTGGNHLNYSTSSHALTCGSTSSGGGGSAFGTAMSSATAMQTFGGL